MALPTNTYTRYTAGTNVREDLINAITNTSPEETPVISSFGTAKAVNTYHEWQRDTLRSANKDNAALDGDDATGSAKTAPGRVANYCQIFQDAITVSGRAEVVDKAGMKSAMAYNKAKAYKELQRDMEAALLSANPAIAGATGTAPKAGGLGVLIYTNAAHGAGGSTTAHTSGAPLTAPVAGTARTFTESLLKTSAQSAFNAVAKVPRMLVMSANHKQIFSGFTGIAVNRFQIDKKKGQGAIVGGADVYMSDFGEMEVVPHYLLNAATTVYGLNVEYGDAVYLRSFFSKQLGATGDNDKEQVIVDATFRLKSETAQFKIADLTA